MKRWPQVRWVSGFEGAPGRQAGQPFGAGIADFVDPAARQQRRALALKLWQE